MRVATPALLALVELTDRLVDCENLRAEDLSARAEVVAASSPTTRRLPDDGFCRLSATHRPDGVVPCPLVGREVGGLPPLDDDAAGEPSTGPTPGARRFRLCEVRPRRAGGWQGQSAPGSGPPRAHHRSWVWHIGIARDCLVVVEEGPCRREVALGTMIGHIGLGQDKAM